MKYKSYIKRLKNGFFHSRASASDGSMSPVQACRAYQFQKVKQVRDVGIAVLSLGGFYSPTSARAAAALYGQQGPVVTVDGVQDPTDADSTGENMLDIEASGASFEYSTDNRARMGILFEANDANGIPNLVKRALALNYEVLTLSWGGPLSQMSAVQRQIRAAAIAACAAVGAHFVCASGDKSLNDGTNARTPDDSSCDVNALCVGGSSLVLNPDGSIKSESAWGDGNAADEGGGGGFAPDEAMPPWQKGVVPGTLRGCPDWCSVADPNTGMQFVAPSSPGDPGTPVVFGGTSVAAPFSAGYIAALLSSLPGRITGTQLQTLLYANAKTAFRDVVLGSNGESAVTGWDEATGLGSINGPGFAAALTGAVALPPPVILPPVTAGPTEAVVQGAVDALFKRSRIVTQRQIDAAIQQAFVTATGQAHASLGVGAIITEIQALIAKYGDDALPLVEDVINNSGLPAAEETALGNIAAILLDDVGATVAVA